MSFAQKAKQEVIKSEIEGDANAFAFLSGIIKGAGVIRDKGVNSTVEIYTDLEFLFDVVYGIVKQYYGGETTVETISDYMALKIIRYKIVIPSDITATLLKDISITEMDMHGNVVASTGIDHHIIPDLETKQSYIKGIFVATATSNIVIKNYENISKNTSGYHLEFVFNSEVLASDFEKLLLEFAIASKLTSRKSVPILYIKEYQLICDALALVGANKAVLSLQNEAAIRDVRNNVNRQLNCFNANLTKTVNSSIKQLAAIEVIQNTIGLEALDESLRELAILRIANPEESLVTLRELYSGDISKSGINHRFDKILKIAEKLRQDSSQD